MEALFVLRGEEFCGGRTVNLGLGFWEFSVLSVKVSISSEEGTRDSLVTVAIGSKFGPVFSTPTVGEGVVEVAALDRNSKGRVKIVWDNKVSVVEGAGFPDLGEDKVYPK